MRQYKLRSGTNIARPPITQEVTPAASAFCPNVTQGTINVTRPEGRLSIGNGELALKSKVRRAPAGDQKRVKMEVKARMDLGFHNNLDLHVPQSSIQAKVPFAHSPILI